jgi:hypothetical protein
MKSYGGAELKLRVLLTLALDGEWSALLSGRSTPAKLLPPPGNF